MAKPHLADRWRMRVETIRDLVHLYGSERKQLADWLGELEKEARDRQMGQIILL